MTPGQFLRRIWPETGCYYCIAHPFTPQGSSVTVYAHKVFDNISAAVTHVHEMQHRADIYFAVLGLKAERVWDPEKKDYKTGQDGAWAVRKQENMGLAKASFFDLDVGTESHKYPTQRDALLALVEFLQKSKLPMPTLVSSGGGVHVYWHYDRAIPAEQWRPIAWHMRQLAEGLGLKVDPMRTTDTTSVLRVPDTFNWKDRSNPRPVKVLQEGAITPVEVFERLISDAMIAHGVTATAAPAPRSAAPAIPHDLGVQTFNDFGPKPTLEELGDACGQVREILRSQLRPDHPHYGQLDNTAWYRGMLGTFKHIEDGDSWCRKLTALHPRTNADIDAKLMQLEQFPPARCETLQQYMPWKDAPCQTCRFKNDPSVPNPVAASRKATVAPPPIPGTGTSGMSGAVQPGSLNASPPPAPPAPTPGIAQLMAPGLAVVAAMIPNPPKPYERLKAGGIALTRKDKDGNETTSVIYPHDLYPLKRLVNTGEQREQQVWRATLPRSGMRDFVIDADVLYDARKFCVAIANNGIYPNKADIPALQDYMVAYISQLQKTIDADTQANHLGWQADYQQFVLPDKTLMADGTVRASALSLGAERAAQFIRKSGDANVQRQLLGFYNRPEYIANQYAVLNSLASIIFDMTGHHGIVVNLSGEAGASKSTTLYTGAGLWGDPKLWPINGTNRGATANARMQRMATNANLPTHVDEITHMPVKEALDLVMGVTQPGHRLRLTTDGVERKVDDGYKSAIMIATANSSLHALISADNAAGTAGSMRVFEMKFFAQRVHSKGEADEYLRQLNLHYGHIGEIFAQFVIQNRAAVARRLHQVMSEVDTEAAILASERFWSADIAAVLVAGEIAQALGILPYDPLALRRWAVHSQVPYMRGVVKEEYRDPLAILTDYIAEKHGNIATINKSTSIGANTVGQAVASETAFAESRPTGALLGHVDLKTGMLLLLKQGFKDYCSRIGASSSRLLEELHAPREDGRRIVIERNARRTLGSGTALAKGQAWCFVVDMTHPELAGALPTVVSSGGVPSAPTGNLQVVK